MKQECSETVDQYLVRLRHQIDNCSFEDDIDEQIREHVISKCRYVSTKEKKLLEKV